jgi:ribosomal protein S21
MTLVPRIDRIWCAWVIIPDFGCQIIPATDLICVRVNGAERVARSVFVVTWMDNKNGLVPIGKGGKEKVTRIERRPDETFESLFSRFRKRVARDRIMGDVKKHRYHVPECERRQAARRKAIRRERQRQWRQSRQHRRPYAWVRRDA